MRGLAGILAGALVLRVALAVFFADLTPRYDETEFLSYGARIASDEGGPALWRAPGYQWFTAAGLLLSGGQAVGVRVLQALLSVGTVALVWRVARRPLGTRGALAASALVALHPSHIAFSHLLWSETLYGFLALAAFALLPAASRRGGAFRAAGAGALLGAAALTRSTGLALLAVSAVWLAASAPRGRRLLCAGALLAAGVVIVAPWSLHASGRAGEPVLIDANGGFNLWSGHNRYLGEGLPALWSVGLAPGNGVGVPLSDPRWREDVERRMAADGAGRGEDARIARDRWYRARAMEEVARDPAAALLRAPGKAAAFWSPDFFLPRHLLRDWYGPVSPGAAVALSLLTLAASVVFLIGGPVGLAAMRRSRFRSLAVSWVAVYFVVHMVVYGHSRMHQPLVPILAVAAVAAARRIRERGILRRSVVVATVVLLLWVRAWPLVAGVYVLPGPRHLGVARVFGSARHLPVAGAHHAAWMLAGAEAAAGNDARAVRLLSEDGVAEREWTAVLRTALRRTDGGPR
ncbi:MAG: glycosyltransferase family 39 protein [Gemmatimonadota bacterium]|nr:glycosyltransferase family 39 protein [Gemmatimonadota bacterium]MDP6801621.1 glycosyltransferase family 39 protein [Gemmatimonadota bacterium]